MDTPCLVLEGLTKEFGGLVAVDHLSLEIKAGERHGIIGPNGAGKTTLFNLICGDLSPTEGCVALSRPHMLQLVSLIRPGDELTIE